jgi:hypothetical protein
MDEMSPRARRYLYMLGVVLAVFPLILFGFVAISRGLDLMRAWHYAAIVALLGYIVYAQRRTTALLKEEAEQSRQEADRVLAPLNLSATLATGLTLRWRTRTYVGLLVALIVLGASAAWAWNERSWLLLALCGLMLAWTARALLGRIREPDALRIGTTGIEDTIGVGLIPWQDIKSVSLLQSEIKGTKIASLSIDVREAYLQRLSPLARFRIRLDTLGFGDAIRIQVHTLDMPPLALFRLIRAFHERSVPAGGISGNDQFYMVDLPFGELKQVVAELEKTLAGPASASGAPTRKQEELAARLDAVVKAHQEQASMTLARADKVRRWPAIVAILLAVLIVVLVGAHMSGRL